MIAHCDVNQREVNETKMQLSCHKYDRIWIAKQHQWHVTQYDTKLRVIKSANNELAKAKKNASRLKYVRHVVIVIINGEMGKLNDYRLNCCDHSN